jgi:fermentation-respiration switch protein FrsA (DUF1100 family)
MGPVIVILCHAAVLLAAYYYTYSWSGFLVTGPGLALLLDRLVFQRRPTWKREISLTAGAFLLGGVAFYFMRPGIVPWWEAAYRGAVVCVVVLAVDTMARAGGPYAWVVRGGALAAILLLAPVIGGLHPLHTVPKRSPAAFGLAFDEVHFSTRDGVELRGWLIPHPRPRGNVIFCHGHGRNRGHVAGVLATLHGLGLNVLAFDFRGHGESGGHTSTFGHREVDDLLTAAAFLRGRCPGQPLFLVGVSLGAAVSLQALPQLPDVKGVWSEGAFARLGNAVEHQFSAVPSVLREPLVRAYYVLGWLDCGMWGPNVNSVDRLRGMTTPVFFCHARNDDLVPFSEGTMLYDAYAGPKEHWWVEGASHFDVRQRNHEEYPRRLREFLEKCLRR